jgi:RNA polymerase sigma factor (TIGR02999 family)
VADPRDSRQWAEFVKGEIVKVVGGRQARQPIRPDIEMTDFAIALQKIEQEQGAALNDAFSSWYPELKKIARARLNRSGLNSSMQTTALVHDSYMKLAAGTQLQFSNRLQFLAYASRTLRSLVIDTIREERALRRGGDLNLVTLDTAVQDGVGPAVDAEDVNAAMNDLAKLDPALARLVEMRFFGGMTTAEIAEALGISERTVQREWSKARALLVTMIEG